MTDNLSTAGMTTLYRRSDGSEPTARVLSRGEYALLLTASGGGFSAFGGMALTRWTADRTRDAEGFYFFLRDEAGEVWSPSYQPTRGGGCRARLGTAIPVLERARDRLRARLEVGLAPEGDAELRRLTLTNDGPEPRRIEVTTYAELVLGTLAADAAHPAFSKLFVQTEWDSTREALLAWRRLRSPDDTPLWAVHRLLGEGPVEWETDRSRFLGRGRTLRTPAALEGAPLSGATGNVLDSVFALRRVVTVPAGGSASVVAVLGAGRDRAAVHAAADRYPSIEAARAVFRDPVGTGGEPAALGVPERWLAALPVLPLPPVEDDAGRDRFRPAQRGGAALPGDGEELRFFNGHGGFSADGREYVIRLPGSAAGPERPPLPWVNVIANEQAGFLVSESGAGNSWTVNSRENRLTPWYNDPVSDPHGEALYLRDEESGRFWSPTPGPVPGEGGYETRHGFGYTRWRHAGGRLEQETTTFVPRGDPVRLVRLRVRNGGTEPRRLSAFFYLHWVLGGLPQETADGVETRADPAAGAVFAVNPDRGEFSGRVAFAAAPGLDAAGGTWTADRAEFLGELGSAESPRALRQAERLHGRVGDPCAAFQVPLEVAPGESAELVFLLGEAADEPSAHALIARYRTAEAADAALAEVRGFWTDLVGGVQVASPSAELDLMLNGWLAYQNLSCRVWGRTAFYQSGGAFGFRDQLQDSSAALYLRPELTREQILLHAAHQFEQGDVLHWWHPPLAKGIRTRFADDLMWLPYITSFYLASTGDAGVLDEEVRFLTARELEPGEEEVFLLPRDAGTSASVYEHCCRAIDRSLTRGEHGLPLIGTGDWNDGMNRVGREGRGESVWLGFFFFQILDDFLPVVRERGDHERAARYERYRSALREALDDGGWDGEWYRRAYYDDGAPLGSAANDECRIDAIAQAWAVLSGAAPPDRAGQALDALERHLVSEQDGIIRLLTPPFDRTPHDPGYIKGYLPGVRENGGQYTHGALWAVRALAEAGRTERAARLLEMLTPVGRTRGPDEVARYRAEPYVVAADVYGVAPHVGRGGWTWYTGSAGWMFRVALESIFGLTREGATHLRLRPCIPRGWPGFELRYRVPGGAEYRITLSRTEGDGIEGEMDGVPLAVERGALRIPLQPGAGTHAVAVRLGRDAAPRYAPRASPPSHL